MPISWNAQDRKIIIHFIKMGNSIFFVIGGTQIAENTVTTHARKMQLKESSAICV